MYICRFLRWWTCRHILVSGQKNNTPLIQILQNIDRILVYKSDGVCHKSAPKSEEKYICVTIATAAGDQWRRNKLRNCRAVRRVIVTSRMGNVDRSNPRHFSSREKGRDFFRTMTCQAHFPVCPHPLHTASLLLVSNTVGRFRLLCCFLIILNNTFAIRLGP